MAKGPPVTERVKALIGEVYLQHPDWIAKQVQAEVNRLLNKKWPGLSAVQVVLKDIKGKMKIENPEDKPWNIGTLSLRPFYIPPQALSMVIKVQKLVGEPVDDMPQPLQGVIKVRNSIQSRSVYSTRDAKWVAQFSGLVPDCIPDIRGLALVSLLCSHFEALYEIVNLPFDSTAIDEMLMIMPVELDDTTSIEDIEKSAAEQGKLFEDESLEIIKELKRRGHLR